MKPVILIPSFVNVRRVALATLFLAGAAGFAADQPQAPTDAKGTGTWNQQANMQISPATGQINYSVRLHMASESLATADIAEQFMQALEKGSPEAREFVARKIKQLASGSDADALELVAADYLDDGQTPWTIRVYHDRTTKLKDSYVFEIETELPLKDRTEFNEVRAYIGDRQHANGRAVLTRLFATNAAARKVLALP